MCDRVPISVSFSVEHLLKELGPEMGPTKFKIFKDETLKIGKTIFGVDGSTNPRSK